MNDKPLPIMRYLVLFTALYASYKLVNILDACARTYLIRRYRVYVEEYPTIPLEKFFIDEDWD